MVLIDLPNLKLIVSCSFLIELQSIVKTGYVNGSNS
jgi:hypothetical protein